MSSRGGSDEAGEDLATESGVGEPSLVEFAATGVRADSLEVPLFKYEEWLDSFGGVGS